MANKINKINYYLDDNKYLLGIGLLLLNIGSKYLMIDIDKGTKSILKLKIIRRLTLFSIFYVGTRDIIFSFLLTAAFVVITEGLFNENSKYCILPDYLLDDFIDEDEYNNAISIVRKYKKQNNQYFSESLL